jgi:hypothetical protein
VRWCIAPKNYRAWDWSIYMTYRVTTVLDYYCKNCITREQLGIWYIIYSKLYKWNRASGALFSKTIVHSAKSNGGGFQPFATFCYTSMRKSLMLQEPLQHFVLMIHTLWTHHILRH